MTSVEGAESVGVFFFLLVEFCIRNLVHRDNLWVSISTERFEAFAM
jgi:hypothetical protein